MLPTLALLAVLAQPVPAAELTIHAGQTGAPISKYVYGQFIEHLGRCIYGGIWAEMLEDRKFFHPVGDKQSPWRSLDAAQAVTMVRAGAFVGEHSPQVTLAGDGKPQGIVQGGLAVRQGKRYVGRVWLAADPGVGPITLALAHSGAAPLEVTVPAGPQFAERALAFVATRDADDAQLSVSARGTGVFRVGTISLMPADNVQGMRPDTLALLRELDAPIYRWPGGNFVSGYNWRDGVGPRDRRPPRKNPAWKGVEHNDFGLDEFMLFCRTLGTEPYIAVNSGLGDVQSAVEEVQYANGPADSPQGKLRAANGHPAPYGVQWFGVGNEMYGKWQLGHMSQDTYIQKHNQFAAAMRAADPSIKLVAVGDAGPWSEGMMRRCAAQMDLISEHFYCHEKPDLAAHVEQIPKAVRKKVEAHRRYRREFESLRGRDIRIAMDEWNYWYGAHVFGELGTRYYLRDALGVAAGLHEFARNSDLIFMANYAQTVNVIGAIKTTPTAAALETTGVALALYRRHFGVLPVDAAAPKPLDAAAAWSADRRTLTIALVNPTRQAQELSLKLDGAHISGPGRRWRIAAADDRAYNEPGKPPVVAIVETEAALADGKLMAAPLSVTLWALPAK